MNSMVEVKINIAGDTQSYLAHGMKVVIGDSVIVEAERGLDNGEVITAPKEVNESQLKHGPYRKIIRKVNPWDEKQIERNKGKKQDLLKICRKKIKEHDLSMKLVDGEYTFDRSKILFYFTADKRVDFRGLVKDLASIFRVRIELRQIGVRDEAKMIGGCGPCGRDLCCRSFLCDFQPVTIKMAKVQNLSLNPAKMSGCCGRLMCCLGYEHDIYKKRLRQMPRYGQKIKSEGLKGRVVSVKPLKNTVVVDFGDGRFKEMDVEEIKKEQKTHERKK